MNERFLKLVCCIGREAIRLRFRALCADLMSSPQAGTAVPGFQLEIAHCDAPAQAAECVRKHLDHGSTHAAILLFDIEAAGTMATNAPEWVQQVCGSAKVSYATIALMERPQRLSDIDRVLSTSADLRSFFEVLTLVSAKLRYTAMPEVRTPAVRSEIRLILKPHELLEAFKLRYRVYKIMGYLVDEIENAPSRMEVNWCDTISLHFGAYVGTKERRDTLAGTARVVVSSSGVNKRQPLLDSYRRWIDMLVKQDPVLQLSLNRGVLPLELPIFQSQRLFKIYRDVLRQNESCGELSRVIVAEEYRGTGVSTRLVAFALKEAGNIGLRRIFLECLLLHEGLYEKLGFKRIAGAPGNVISVNQTMIGMELSPPLETSPNSSETVCQKVGAC